MKPKFTCRDPAQKTGILLPEVCSPIEHSLRACSFPWGFISCYHSNSRTWIPSAGQLFGLPLWAVGSTAFPEGFRCLHEIPISLTQASKLALLIYKKICCVTTVQLFCRVSCVIYLQLAVPKYKYLQICFRQLPH